MKQKNNTEIYRKIIQKNNETKSLFFEKDNKTYEPLARLKQENKRCKI